MAFSRSTNTAQGLQRVLSEWVRNAVHTAMPGLIDSVNMRTRRAQVRIALEAVTSDNTCMERAPLLDVPILFPSGAGGMIVIHLERDDPVWIMFSERGLQDFKKAYAMSEPMPRRIFSMSDAVALAGFGPSGSATLADTGGILMQTNDAQVHIHIGSDGITLDVPEDGYIRLGAGAIERLLKETFIDAFNRHTHTFANIESGRPNQQAAKGDTLLTTKARV